MQQKWRQRGLGRLWDRRMHGLGKITHQMFADDTTLVASCKQDLIIMVSNVQEALAIIGLSQLQQMLTSDEQE